MPGTREDTLSHALVLEPSLFDDPHHDRPPRLPPRQDDAVDFVGSLLRYDHQERLTAQEAMGHAYFAPVRQASQAAAAAGGAAEAAKIDDEAAASPAAAQG